MELDVPMSPDTIFENKMKKQKIEALKDTTKTTTTTTVNDGYLDADFVLGTNVIAERLFSTAKFVLTDQRLSLSPTLFNYMMLLKFNKPMWSIATVARAIKGKMTIVLLLLVKRRMKRLINLFLMIWIMHLQGCFKLLAPNHSVVIYYYYYYYYYTLYYTLYFFI